MESLTVKKYEVEDHIAVDSNYNVVTLMLFKGKFPKGSTGWATEMELDLTKTNRLIEMLTTARDAVLKFAERVQDFEKRGSNNANSSET